MIAESRATTRPNGGAREFFFSDTHADAAAGIFVAWARYLADRGHPVVLAHPTPGTDRGLISQFSRFGARTVEVPELSSNSALLAAKGLLRAVRSGSSATPVLVATESVPMRAHALLSLRYGWPAIHHALLLRTGADPRTRAREFVDRHLVRRSNTTVLACSRGVAEHWAERLGVPWEQVVYQPNWVDAERFSPMPEGVERGRVPRLVCVAAFRPIKLQHVLIEAAALLKSRGIELRVTFVGGADRPEQAPYLEHCRREVERLGLHGDVEFLGRRDDIVEILRSAAAFVFPSRQEGLACAMLEAMAVGTPVVAAAIHASYEVLRNGHNGFLTRVGDPVELAGTIEAVLALTPDERRRIGLAARATVVEGYTLERATKLSIEALGRRSIHV